ncbi:MAG: beta-glucosidase [Anaerolineae bacterium]|nr:beta-glucosidase [Anaerolineae bacterium]
MKEIWSQFDVADSSYYDPSVFGELIFFEIGQTEPARVVLETVAEVLPVIAEDALYKQADAPIAERVDDLLAQMTLEEKIGQMTLIEKNSVRGNDVTKLSLGGLLSGGGGYPAEGNDPTKWAAMVDGFQQSALDSRLGIPLIYGVDAVHGHNNVVGAVIFPHNIGLGAANDPDLMQEIGQVTALEMAATGIYWNYAPGVMVPQDIRWGRTYEGYSENTELVSALGAAYLQGLQSPELFEENTAIGTPKHFVGDGGAVWGTGSGSYQIDQGVTEVDEETLRAVHLPPYQAVIDAGARSIMISYSSWGGMKMHAQQYLISDVLRDEMGFTGFIVSDWEAIDQISGNYYADVVTSINAGVDMNMVPYNAKRFIDTLTEAVEAGDVPISRIDDAVRRILTVKMEMELFEQPFSQPELLAEVGSDAHRGLAREAVAKSLVLLKNDGNLLPLDKDTPQIFVGGIAADDIGIQSGGWTIEWQGKKGEITQGTSILAGIQNAIGSGTQLEYSKAGKFQGDTGAADSVCVAIVGETPYAEGQGDSKSLKLPTNELRVLRNMEAECANLAVILISGRPLIITDFVDEWDALVSAWLPGSEGAGVADVLFGDLPFSGTLPYTWPASVEQLPLGASTEAPLFPYGFGLTGE